MPKVHIKSRLGKDFFTYLEISEENKDRGNEWALTEFVEIDGAPLELTDMVKLSGEQLSILKGRVFSLQSKDVKQTDTLLIYSNGVNLTIKKKEISHDMIEKMQTKILRLQEKGNVTSAETLKVFIPMFYDISIKELDEYPYQITAFMFNKINSFFSKSAQAIDDFELEDL
jgi:hypothetical protein